MTNSDSARGLRGSGNPGLTAKRRQRGTSLVEILVVIVIFLIGILAVVQVFPRGFQLLLTTRNNSVATALGREAVERLKGSPELIPDEVVPVVYVNGVPVVDPTVSPVGLAPQGDSLDVSGVLTRGGQPVAKDWKLASGPNVARRILGEGHRLPSVRQVGPLNGGLENYGSLLVLDHNPVDPGPSTDSAYPRIVAYGNELSRTEGAPRETLLHQLNVADDSAAGVGAQAVLPSGATSTIADASTFTTPVSTAPFEFFVVNATANGAANGQGPAVLLPALSSADRTYHIRLSAYVSNGSGGASRVDYTSLSVFVPRMKSNVGATPAVVPPQLVLVPLAEVLKADGLIVNNSDLLSIVAESVRVAPQFRRVLTTWSTANSQGLDSTSYPTNRDVPIDPFEVKVRDANLGVLLFSPAVRNGVVSRPGGASEPLLAKVDYDVLDWRVIGEDFRITNRNEATVLLSLQSLKVGGNNGPDGLTNGGIFNGAFQSNDGNLLGFDPSPTPRDNVMILDLTTGYEVAKYSNQSTDALGRTKADGTSGGDVLVSVDKSRGSLTFRDANPGNTNGNNVDPLDVVLIPPTGNPITVDSANRTFRVLYRARQEWAVQTLKGSSQYNVVSSLPSGPNFLPDMAFLGDGATSGTSSRRIYFPASQVGQKITIDRIAYLWTDNSEHILEGQDFILKTGGGDSTSLAYADLADVDTNATSFSTLRYGTSAAQGIKGASVSVRVLWNPESLTLTVNSDTNFARIEQYDRGWRRSTTQTYLRAEETR